MKISCDTNKLKEQVIKEKICINSFCEHIYLCMYIIQLKVVVSGVGEERKNV